MLTESLVIQRLRVDAPLSHLGVEHQHLGESAGGHGARPGNRTGRHAVAQRLRGRQAGRPVWAHLVQRVGEGGRQEDGRVNVGQGRRLCAKGERGGLSDDIYLSKYLRP